MNAHDAMDGERRKGLFGWFRRWRARRAHARAREARVQAAARELHQIFEQVPHAKKAWIISGTIPVIEEDIAPAAVSAARSGGSKRDLMLASRARLLSKIQGLDVSLDGAIQIGDAGELAVHPSKLEHHQKPSTELDPEPRDPWEALARTQGPGMIELLRERQARAREEVAAQRLEADQARTRLEGERARIRAAVLDGSLVPRSTMSRSPAERGRAKVSVRASITEIGVYLFTPCGALSEAGQVLPAFLNVNGIDPTRLLEEAGRAPETVALGAAFALSASLALIGLAHVIVEQALALFDRPAGQTRFHGAMRIGAIALLSIVLCGLVAAIGHLRAESSAGATELAQAGGEAVATMDVSAAFGWETITLALPFAVAVLWAMAVPRARARQEEVLKAQREFDAAREQEREARDRGQEVIAELEQRASHYEALATAAKSNAEAVERELETAVRKAHADLEQAKDARKQERKSRESDVWMARTWLRGVEAALGLASALYDLEINALQASSRPRSINGTARPGLVPMPPTHDHRVSASA